MVVHVQVQILCAHCSQPTTTSLAEVAKAVVNRDLRSGVDDFLRGLQRAPRCAVSTGWIRARAQA